MKLINIIYNYIKSSFFFLAHLNLFKIFSVFSIFFSFFKATNTLNLLINYLGTIGIKLLDLTSFLRKAVKNNFTYLTILSIILESFKNKLPKSFSYLNSILKFILSFSLFGSLISFIVELWKNQPNNTNLIKTILENLYIIIATSLENEFGYVTSIITAIKNYLMNLFYPLSDITPNIPNIPNKIKNIINPTNIDKITEADVVKDNLVENENKKHFSLRKTYKDMIISNFSNYSQYFTTENVLYGLVAVTFIAGSSYCWFNGINPIDFIPDSVKNIFGYLFAPGIIIDKVCETSAVVYNYTLGPVWDGISNLWSYARGTRGATANPDVVNALNKGKEVIKLALQGSIFESNWFAFNDVFSGAVHIIPQSLFQFYKDNLYFELTPFPM